MQKWLPNYLRHYLKAFKESNQVVFSVEVSANFDEELEVLEVAGGRNLQQCRLLLRVELLQQRLLRRQLLQEEEEARLSQEQNQQLTIN